MAAQTGFFLHPASPLHDTGWGHPEHQGRLRALASTVGKDLLTLHGHVEQMESRLADQDELALVHTPGHIEVVANACRMAEESERIVSIDWGAADGDRYAVDIVIKAHNRSGLLRDISELVSNSGINAISTMPSSFVATTCPSGLSTMA